MHADWSEEDLALLKEMVDMDMQGHGQGMLSKGLQGLQCHAEPKGPKGQGLACSAHAGAGQPPHGGRHQAQQHHQQEQQHQQHRQQQEQHHHQHQQQQEQLGGDADMDAALAGDADGMALPGGADADSILSGFLGDFTAHLSALVSPRQAAGTPCAAARAHGAGHCGRTSAAGDAAHRTDHDQDASQVGPAACRPRLSPAGLVPLATPHHGSSSTGPSSCLSCACI
jgi:hypothetical protein